MNIQEHLTAFDGWLTGRLEEAYADRKDLAFRDTSAEIRLGDNAWEYTLLSPGAHTPQGDGWSVYRLQGVWPEFAQPDSESSALSASSASAPAPGRKSLLGRISEALLGPHDPKRR